MLGNVSGHDSRKHPFNRLTSGDPAANLRTADVNGRRLNKLGLGIRRTQRRD
jgi:hypothetical protein